MLKQANTARAFSTGCITQINENLQNPVNHTDASALEVL